MWKIPNQFDSTRFVKLNIKKLSYDKCLFSTLVVYYFKTTLCGLLGGVIISHQKTITKY